MNDWISKKFFLIIMYVMQLSFGKNYFPLFIVCRNRFYFGHVFIRQFMHFPSGILLYKNLPIYSMVNRISFCSRNSMFLPGKSEKFPLLIVCRIWFHFGPLLRSAGKTKKHNNDSYCFAIHHAPMIDWFVSRQKCIEGRGKISSHI